MSSYITVIDMSDDTRSHSDIDGRRPRIDLNLLALFDAVMTERHVTRAAERLDMTQSAVSNALNRLRKQFGDPLFVKAARGVEPTPRALSLWPSVHDALEQLRETVQPQTFDAAGARREFRMSMVDLSAALLTPYLYRLLHARAPGVTLSLVPHAPELTAERLNRGEVEFAISVEPPRFASLESRRLWSERYVLAARKGHPLMEGPLDAERLCSVPHLAVNLWGSSDARNPIDEALSLLGLSRHVSLTVNQFLVATAMLRESDLVAVLPARLLLDAFRQEWLAFQPVPLALPEAVLHLVWHRRSSSLAPIGWFRELVIEATTEMNKEVEATD